MPEKLVKFFIIFLTTKGDLVLDPFSGSNTTGTVANRLKRKWISIEAVPNYATAGVSNFNEKKAKKLLKQFQAV